MVVWIYLCCETHFNRYRWADTVHRVFIVSGQHVSFANFCIKFRLMEELAYTCRYRFIK